jgi:ppGpp synthetase/RelA/SpoT-type nucleotidyltranferase
MTEKMSNTQLKKLGARLAKSRPRDGSDLDLLDEYRDHINGHLREMEAIVRRACPDVSTRIKTHDTLFDKLTKIDLGKIQDVGGARCVVPDREAQDRLSAVLRAVLPVEKIVDRRADPRCGYRAIHLIVEFPDKCPIEVQIRTEWQKVSKVSS